MDDDIKIVFWRYLTLDYKAVQDYLEDMALKGYELISIYSIIPFAKFKKITPRRIRYYTDIFEIDESKSNIDLCKNLGWQLIGSKEKIYIFKAKYNYRLIPIQKDKDRIKKSLIKKEFTVLLIEFFVLFLLFYSSIIKLDYKMLLSYSSCSTLFYITVTILYSIIYILYLFNFIVKLNRAIKEEEVLRVPTVESAKLRAYCKFLYNVSFNVIIILLLLGSICDISQIIPIVLTFIAIGTISVILIRKTLKNTDKIRKIRNTVLVVVVMSVVSFVSLAQFNFKEILYLAFSDWDSNENRQKAVEYPVLKLSDFFQDKDLNFTFQVLVKQKVHLLTNITAIKKVYRAKE